MQKIKLIFNCIIASTLTTLTIMVFSFLHLLFTHDQPGRHTTYFGTIILNISENSPDWDLYMQFGLNFNRLQPIWMTILLIGIIYYVISILYINVQNKRQATP